MGATHGRSIGVVIASNLLGGVGVASGVAVGGLLAERLGGTSVAGLAQAAVAAVPLATLAAKKGRRRSLALGYTIAVFGALLIIASGILDQLVVLLDGLGLFGVAQAVNLQSRYAAADNAPVASRARTMSIVIWATTIGSVAGPNLTAPGNRLGIAVGLPELVRPYLSSVLSFASAATVIALLFRPAPLPTQDVEDERTGPGTAGGTGVSEPAKPASAVGAIACLKWAGRHPVARFAVVLIACAHAVMVMVMVMVITPLHMQHHGMSLELVGIVISLHVLGMYALSPVWGWAADRFGAVHVAIVGMVLQIASVGLGFVAAFGNSALTMVALTVLGPGVVGLRDLGVRAPDHRDTGPDPGPAPRCHRRRNELRGGGRRGAGRVDPGLGRLPGGQRRRRDHPGSGRPTHRGCPAGARGGRAR